MSLKNLLKIIPNSEKIQCVGDGTINALFGTNKVPPMTKSELISHISINGVIEDPIDVLKMSVQNNILELELIISD